MQREREQRTGGATKGEPSPVLCDTALGPELAKSERGSSGRLAVMRLCPRQSANPRVTRRRCSPARPLLGLPLLHDHEQGEQGKQPAPSPPDQVERWRVRC